jgi:hypothetical protein
MVLAWPVGTAMLALGNLLRLRWLRLVGVAVFVWSGVVFLYLAYVNLVVCGVDRGC